MSTDDASCVAVGRARVHQISPEAAAALVCRLAASGGGHLVVTPNISHIVLLEREPQLRAAYEAATLVVPDGWPVARVMTLLTKQPQRRVNGTELVLEVLRLADHTHLRVAVVGGVDDAAERCAAVIRHNYPGVRVAFVDPAPPACIADAQCAQDLAHRIGAAGVDVLILGLGAPKQEIFAATCRPRVGVTLAVGSAIEFIGGVRRRAPKGWRQLGLEWLFRLLTEPRRLAGRYLRDGPLFLAVVLRQVVGRRRVSA